MYCFFLLLLAPSCSSSSSNPGTKVGFNLHLLESVRVLPLREYQVSASSHALNVVTSPMSFIVRHLAAAPSYCFVHHLLLPAPFDSLYGLQLLGHAHTSLIQTDPPGSASRNFAVQRGCSAYATNPALNRSPRRMAALPITRMRMRRTEMMIHSIQAKAIEALSCPQ